MRDGRAPLVITLNAIRRYRERVEKIPARLVVERLRGRAFDACNQMGGGAVILSSGHRVVCGDGAVITVLMHGQRFYGFYGKHRR